MLFDLEDARSRATGVGCRRNGLSVCRQMGLRDGAGLSRLDASFLTEGVGEAVGEGLQEKDKHSPLACDDGGLDRHSRIELHLRHSRQLIVVYFNRCQEIGDARSRLELGSSRPSTPADDKQRVQARPAGAGRLKVSSPACRSGCRIRWEAAG